MSIQYLSDSVTFNYPNGTQTDYEALISIMFSVVTDNVPGEPYTYTTNVVGGTSQGDIQLKFNQARSAITDETLLAYVASIPTS